MSLGELTAVVPDTTPVVTFERTQDACQDARVDVWCELSMKILASLNWQVALRHQSSSDLEHGQVS